MRVYDVAPSLLLFRSVLSWTTATTITTRHRSVSRKATFMSLQTQMDDSLDIFHDDNGDPTNEIANDNDTLLNDRRHVLERIVTMTGIATMAAATVAASPFTPLPAQAADEASSSSVFTRETKQFGYSVKPPSTYQQSSKPVKTHLDEINFISDTIKGCQFGITVDPVRINSLKEFGTPEQVAARVVTAEVNRDGIFEVTLIDDPYESNDGAYVLHYLSTGKRGNKHYITKFFISRNQLYALTAQIKEDNYNETTKEELFNIVNSFSLL